MSKPSLALEVLLVFASDFFLRMSIFVRFQAPFFFRRCTTLIISHFLLPDLAEIATLFFLILQNSTGLQCGTS